MSQVSTYSAFRCNDSIVVFHQHGHGVPQALLIFREPQRMAIHDKKLIAFYTFSKEAETLLEDPQHDAAEVLNAIALQIKVQGQAVMKRRLKSLALVVAGAMFASVIWMTGTPEYSPFHSVSTAQQIPTVQTAAQPAPVQMNMATPLTTGKTFSQAAQTEEQNMQSIMQDSRNALPASPSEVLQTPATAGTAPVTNVTTAKAEVTSQSGRQQMVDILKRSTDRGLFTVSPFIRP